jgi:hypothetical protein
MCYGQNHMVLNTAHQAIGVEHKITSWRIPEHWMNLYKIFKLHVATPAVSFQYLLVPDDRL